MRFTKMHGLGNDYVFVNCFGEQVGEPAALARSISDRHTGVGSDGLILIHPSRKAHLRMEMYNADGSRGRMCGNGIRCLAKYALERGLIRGDPHQDGLVGMRIETDSGVKRLTCNLSGGIVGSVRVDMGRPVFDPAALPANISGERIVDYPCHFGAEEFLVTCVSLGNPHAVVFVEQLHTIDLVRLGPAFELAPQFPERINAHFVRVDAPDHVTVRTWERGSGATRACGTGACAVCVAGAVTGRTARTVTATLPGGDLSIEWADNDHVYMTGPAVEVFSGDWPV